jgi:hypothetical protein
MKGFDPKLTGNPLLRGFKGKFRRGFLRLLKMVTGVDEKVKLWLNSGSTAPLLALSADDDE